VSVAGVALVVVVYMLSDSNRVQGVVGVLGAIGRLLGRGGNEAGPVIINVSTQEPEPRITFETEIVRGSVKEDDD
jgi:hypothetical protein